LIARGSYTDEQLPSVQTIASKLNVLGFRLRTVVKSRPQKKGLVQKPPFQGNSSTVPV
jgi:hypothetical protein